MSKKQTVEDRVNQKLDVLQAAVLTMRQEQLYYLKHGHTPETITPIQLHDLFHSVQRLNERACQEDVRERYIRVLENQLGCLRLVLEDVLNVEPDDDGDRYLTEAMADAIRQALFTIGAPAKPAHVVVMVKWGCVQEVLTDIPMEVLSVDYDTEGLAEVDLAAVPQDGGLPPVKAYVGEPTCSCLPARVEQLFGLKS